MNGFLIIAGILSLIAALLHVVIIIGGPDWYRFFGAGEKMACMAEEGSLYPGVVTALISLVLVIWALYAFSGAGLITDLPLLKAGLTVITAVYLIRGLVLLPMVVVKPALIDRFWVWSSAICLIYGLTHLTGTMQVWRSL